MIQYNLTITRIYLRHKMGNFMSGHFDRQINYCIFVHIIISLITLLHLKTPKERSDTLRHVIARNISNNLLYLESLYCCPHYYFHIHDVLTVVRSGILLCPGMFSPLDPCWLHVCGMHNPSSCSALLVIFFFRNWCLRNVEPRLKTVLVLYVPHTLMQ